MGLLTVAVTEALATTWSLRVLVATPIGALVWLWEGLRRLDDRWDVLTFGCSHESEVDPTAKNITSFAFFAAGMVLLAWTAPRAVCSAAMATLAVGDPAAAYVGRRVGRTPIGTRGKTLEGACAFFAAAFACTFVTLLSFYGASLVANVATAATAALAGATAEVLAPVDDNIAVPLCAAAGAMLAASAVPGSEALLRM